MLVSAAQAQERFRTPWGDPDLQGIWSNATLTPLERPADIDKEYLTESEAEELNRTGVERTLDSLDVGPSGDSSEVWLELGQAVRTRRTSLVIDPPNGRVPYTPEGVRRRNLEMAKFLSQVPIDSWEDRTLWERCLMTGGLLVPNAFYLNNHQIFQSPDQVAIRSEVMNETRFIALGDRKPLDPAIKLWSGASRGHWEGETLVVETTNFNDKGGTITASVGLHLVERFTRADADTIDYQLTVTDPVMYTRPWTLANTLRAVEGPIYEYACHEGNYSLENILSGARAQEKALDLEKRRRQTRTTGSILIVLMLAVALFVYMRGRSVARDGK